MEASLISRCERKALQYVEPISLIHSHPAINMPNIKPDLSPSSGVYSIMGCKSTQHFAWIEHHELRPFWYHLELTRIGTKHTVYYSHYEFLGFFCNHPWVFLNSPIYAGCWRFDGFCLKSSTISGSEDLQCYSIPAPVLWHGHTSQAIFFCWFNKDWKLTGNL